MGQKPRARHQEPDTKSHAPRATCQSYMAQKLEKSQIQMGHPWNQHLTSRLSLLMIFDITVNSYNFLKIWHCLSQTIRQESVELRPQHSWFEYRIIQTKIH